MKVRVVICLHHHMYITKSNIAATFSVGDPLFEDLHNVVNLYCVNGTVQNPK
ncbi:MAG: hypothetical protein ABSA54_12535 [Terriglobales bacterium]|jgi:hypothetical protein